MTITELGMHYYLILDVFFSWCIYAKKSSKPVSCKKTLLCSRPTEMETQISQFLLFQREA